MRKADNKMIHEVTMHEFQHNANNTAIYPDSYTTMGLLYTTLGLAGEAGEFAGKVSKVLRDSGGIVTPEIRRKLIAELGDVLWFVAQTATELGVDLTNVAVGNIVKLSGRQKAGALSGEGDNC